MLGVVFCVFFSYGQFSINETRHIHIHCVNKFCGLRLA